MKIYVGTYAKYNNGSLFGEWIDLDVYSSKDEFLDYCLELHNDEEDPELMFQDWECSSDWENSFISESYLNEDYFEFRDEISSRDIDEDALTAFLNLRSYSKEQMEISVLDDFQNQFMGEYDSLADYEESLAEESGTLNEIPENFRYYIDWESMARDDELSGYLDFENGYVFCNN